MAAWSSCAGIGRPVPSHAPTRAPSSLRAVASPRSRAPSVSARANAIRDGHAAASCRPLSHRDMPTHRDARSPANNAAQPGIAPRHGVAIGRSAPIEARPPPTSNPQSGAETLQTGEISNWAWTSDTPAAARPAARREPPNARHSPDTTSHPIDPSSMAAAASSPRA
jgi:hypothetical protein